MLRLNHFKIWIPKRAYDQSVFLTVCSWNALHACWLQYVD